MPEFLETVEQQFGSRDLYVVLGVVKTAEEADMRRAYRRLSLKVHPDRVAPEDVATATEKFQTLGKIYSVLTDKDKRAIYDEDGTVDEEDTIFDQERDWTDYWRLLFPKVTMEDIKSFEKNYKESEQEAEDLKKAYRQHNGDMDRIMEEVLCSTAEDEPRYHSLLSSWVGDGTLPDFPAFSKESAVKKRKRKQYYKREANSAKKMKMEETNGDLTALIRARQETRVQRRDSFIADLEQKYSESSSSKSASDGSRRRKPKTTKDSSRSCGGSGKKTKTRKKN